MDLKEIIEKYDKPEYSDIIQDLKEYLYPVKKMRIKGLRYIETDLTKRNGIEEKIKHQADIIAEILGVPLNEILKRNRKSDITYLRYMLFYCLYTYCNVNLLGIKRMYNYDHTTVRYGIERVRFDVETDYKNTNKILSKIICNIYE
jgi:chromosomal replication initiation ATPase DnaA